MTPKERAREAAKKLVRAYEVGATMKDLDGVVHMWEKIVEKAITAAIAELEAENAKLTRAVLHLRGDCVKPDDVADYLRVCRNRDALEAENARLRKVAAAAVAWFACEDNGDAEANVYMALHDAVREYRKDLPQNCHSGNIQTWQYGHLKPSDAPLTLKKPDGE